MGQRITIDSASMFNKALELIETREFFGIDPAQIEVLVHPESLVHALVGFREALLKQPYVSTSLATSMGEYISAQ